MLDVYFLWSGRLVCIAGGVGLMCYLLCKAVRWPIRFIFTLNEYRNRGDLRTAMDLFREHEPEKFLRFAERNHLKLPEAMHRQCIVRMYKKKGGA
jgi:hypothetical protein